MKIRKIFSSALIMMFLFIIPSIIQAQNQKVKLTGTEITLKMAFEQIEKQTGLSVDYDAKAIDVTKVIKTNPKISKLNDLLVQLLEGTDCKCTFRQSHIIITAPAVKIDNKLTNESQQPTSISGVVRDEQNVSVIGVSVRVQGTQNATITNMNGSFSLSNVPSNGNLEITYVGMEKKLVPVNAQKTFDVILSAKNKDLDEVVVIGYGSVKKSDLTGAIASVSQKDLKDRPNNNVMQSVAGKVAGVQVLQTDGSAGYSPTVRVRGAASVTSGTTPLYVIDGIPIEGANLNIINPDDIESMEILKDASSAAIYGSRGSNGVVLIATKSGKSGKTNFEVSYEKGSSKLLRHIDMMNSQQYIQFFIDAHNNSWIADKKGNASDPNSARTSTYQIPPEFLTDPGKFATTDWQDAIFRQGSTDKFSFSMNGGNEKTRFMISSSYLTQKGIVDNNDFKRYNLTANLNHKVNSNLTIGANVLLAKRDENPLGSYNMTPEIGKQAAVSNALVAQPFYPVYNENGNLGPFDPNSTWGRFLPYGIAFVNPLIFSRAMDRQSKSLNTLSTLFIEWKFLNDFTFKSSISAAIDYSTYDAYIYDKADYGWDQLPASRAYASYSNHLNWLTENTITFNKTIGKHSINAFVGYTAQKDEYQSGNITATGFPNDQVHTLNAATTASSFSSTASEWSLLSNIGRANYTYDSKYLLTATLRRDGSSRFGKNTKWGYFPSGSLGWRMNEEDFMKSISWIDNMKLRLSYGVTGNNLIPNYGSVGLLGQSQYAWGSTSEPGLYINSIPNPDLKWEKTGQWDLGLNVGLFANRIYMEVDYYQSVTRDMLLNVPVPSITGFTTQLTNIGQLQNNGFEFLISTKNLTGEFKWSTDFNISTNKNKVLQLGTDGAPIYSSGNYGVTKTEVGQPIANFYGYVFDGVFMTQAQTDAKNADGTYVIPRPVSATGVSLSTAGDPIIRDVNKDGKIDANDRTTIGNAQPDFTFGLTNTFQYKNFDFSFCLQGQYGNEIINSQARFSKTYNGGRNQYAAVSNYWKSEANPGDGKAFKPMLTYNALQSAFSTYWVEDGSFLRIRNVQLGYNVPKKALEWSPLASARIYVNAENLHVFTSYIGYDPENSAYSGLDLGNDYGATPMPMTITFGMKLNF